MTRIKLAVGRERVECRPRVAGPPDEPFDQRRSRREAFLDGEVAEERDRVVIVVLEVLGRSGCDRIGFGELASADNRGGPLKGSWVRSVWDDPIPTWSLRRRLAMLNRRAGSFSGVWYG